MGSATTESLTPEQLAQELGSLEKRLTMTVDQAEALAAADALDTELFQILRRIRDLRWLQEA